MEEWVRFHGTAKLSGDTCALAAGDACGGEIVVAIDDVRFEPRTAFENPRVRAGASVTIVTESKPTAAVLGQECGVPGGLMCVGGLLISIDRGAIVRGCTAGKHCPKWPGTDEMNILPARQTLHKLFSDDSGEYGGDEIAE